MPAEKPVSIKELLDNTKVKSVTDNINLEVLERRESVPPKCDVFSKDYTILDEDLDYNFNIGNEARESLPKIIENKVQKIVGIDSPDESFKKEYCKTRNISLVF
ncbi:MAG: phosphofructokinase, partial [Deltaproteobacteria bacterium]|nr:phosphofructokinase [Deltaproteobacteria bacterium]